MANTVRCGRTSTDTLRGYNYTADSDLRLKENIQNLTLGLNFINSLRPVTYKWKDKAFKGDDRKVEYHRNHAGFIAQEIGKALSDIGVDLVLYQDGAVNNGITEEKPIDLENFVDPGDLKGYSVEQLLAISVKAIQELSESLTILKNRVDAL